MGNLKTVKSRIGCGFFALSKKFFFSQSYNKIGGKFLKHDLLPNPALALLRYRHKNAQVQQLPAKNLTC